MNSLQQYLVEEELEHYRDGWIGRREFMRRALLLGAGAAAAAAMAQTVAPPRRLRAAPLAQLSPFHVPIGDPRVADEWITYPAADGVPITSYTAWPAGAAPGVQFPGVVVIHDNQGVDAHIQDVVRRYAVQGYFGIAPDFVTRDGPPSASYTDRTVFLSVYAAQGPNPRVLDGAAAARWLTTHPQVDASRLAITGFCGGGSAAWAITTMVPELRAAAPFYGGNPPLADVPNIRAAILAHYGGLDSRVNAGIPAIVEAMEAAGTTYEIHIHPGAQHGFHRDFNTNDYHPEAATEAWTETLHWFAAQLDLPAPAL